MLHLGKRIDPAPPASADLRHDPAGSVFRARRGENVRRPGGLDELRDLRRGQVRTGRGAKGRLIRHADLMTAAVGALAITMIEASFGALLVTAIGFAALEAAGFFTAPGAAITLAAVTMAAEIKHRAAGREVTHALAKNRGTSDGHRFRQAALDNRRRSWQDDSR